jgi:cyclic pyranopterin phosphate synthase
MEDPAMQTQPGASGMVDVSGKDVTRRLAVAESVLAADAQTLAALRANRLPKLDPLPTARAAALLALKATPNLIPHCHPIPVTDATVEFDLAEDAVTVRCTVGTLARTGAEMEALVGASVATLTLYDMIKGVCRGAQILRTRLVSKSGGKSGNWRADDAVPDGQRLGRVVAVCLSTRVGEVKRPVPAGRLVAGHGLEGDAHAGTGRQVSVLCQESADRLRGRGLDIHPGDFAENLLVEGLGPGDFSLGTRIRIGEALLEVMQVGKECHNDCAIRRQTGDCVMPREGIFARVLAGGTVRAGDAVEVQTHHDDTTSTT